MPMCLHLVYVHVQKMYSTCTKAEPNVLLVYIYTQPQKPHTVLQLPTTPTQGILGIKFISLISCKRFCFTSFYLCDCSLLQVKDIETALPLEDTGDTQYGSISGKVGLQEFEL